MRIEDKDGDEADGFFYADGLELVPVFLLDKLKPCIRSFTYEEGAMRSFIYGEASAGRHDFRNSNGVGVIVNKRLMAGKFEEKCDNVVLAE
jgi:hypothetical protein